MGRVEEFAQVRNFFRSAEFDDATVCRALAIDAMSDMASVRWDEIRLDTLSAPLRWCIETFVRGTPPPAQQSRALCGEETFAAFRSLGLLRAARHDPAAIVSPIWLYPIAGFIVVSDRHDDPEGETFVPPEDIVFPALHAGTLSFLRLLPATRGGEALDLCGGAGIGALHLARSARLAVTADVTERAAFFAAFNGRLNDMPISSVCGDLYEPVKSQQFDLISAHPPYVPAVGTHMVFRDAGDTGEEITRRVIEGLPAHLHCGGICVIVCTARDTEKPFEQRARDWLGPVAPEFDVILSVEKVRSVEDVVASMRERGMITGDEQAQAVTARLRALDTRHFVSGALIMRRCAEPVLEAPVRLRLSDDATAADFERLFAWRRHARWSDFSRWLAESRPRLAPDLQLTVRHAVHEGELVPADCVFSKERGIRTELRIERWVVPLIARFDGDRSVAQVYAAARNAGEMPDELTLEAFASLVRLMIERDLLRVDLPQ